MRGRLGRCRQSSDQVRGPLVDSASTGQSSRYACYSSLRSDSALASCNRPRDGAKRDEEAELALAELRSEIDSLKRQHDAERPGEGVDIKGNEQELMEQGAAQLRGQLEEGIIDEEMDMNKGDGAADVMGVACGEEQEMSTEGTKHQPEHIVEEKEMVDRTSTLPFRLTLSQSTDKAKVLFRPLGPSCTRTEERPTNE